MAERGFRSLYIFMFAINSSVHNFVKAIKLFCEMNNMSIPWKKITRGLPKGRKYAYDRAPTIEDINE
jgi:hypothetical protein